MHNLFVGDSKQLTNASKFSWCFFNERTLVSKRLKLLDARAQDSLCAPGFSIFPEHTFKAFFHISRTILMELSILSQRIYSILPAIFSQNEKIEPSLVLKGDLRVFFH